jgi:cytochrome c oxidase assembly protein subunit 15|tara:strand:+ start:4529 stop:5539 length:1011 start_codon:yes stop_codon:yes gene_type:complete
MFVNIDPYTKFIRLWLVSIFILVIIIIVVGGLTRLTDSGLSITNWELFRGIFPPLNIDKWNFYFSEYKKIPEFKSINYNMSLDEFKIIYYWEYAHRLIARLIGVVSIVPLIIIYLKYKDKLSKDLKYLSIFSLVCFQGFLGWFMVKSGLIDNTDVSHYRLASHLSVALIVLSLTFWFILNNFKINKFDIKISSYFLIFFLIIIIIQVILGAFLAGLNGGLLYNSWPDMNGNFIPDDVVKSDLFKIDSLNNASVIQFYHRLFAYTLIIFLIILNYLFYKKKIKSKSIVIFNIAILFQIILGIITLITGVKIYYASLHQLGSVFVLSSFLFIYYKNTN